MTARSRGKLSSDVSVVAVYGWAGHPWGPILPYVLTDANIAADHNESSSSIGALSNVPRDTNIGVHTHAEVGARPAPCMRASCGA